jgi:hypothetical protein
MVEHWNTGFRRLALVINPIVHDSNIPSFLVVMEEKND